MQPSAPGCPAPLPPPWPQCCVRGCLASVPVAERERLCQTVDHIFLGMAGAGLYEHDSIGEATLDALYKYANPIPSPYHTIWGRFCFQAKYLLFMFGRERTEKERGGGVSHVQTLKRPRERERETTDAACQPKRTQPPDASSTGSTRPPVPASTAPPTEGETPPPPTCCCDRHCLQYYLQYRRVH
ncbi:hypothetical protein KIPB_014734, partial [Kipferlia bialata]|eukprot:g14734.t1